MTKKPMGIAGGNSEAVRIYERMEEERQRRAQAKAEANKAKKVTLPRLKFLAVSSANVSRFRERSCTRVS